MDREYWSKWIKAAGVRALKTVAQTAVATIGVSQMMSEVNWGAVASTALLAGILSLLTSLAGIPEAKPEYASIQSHKEGDGSDAD